VDTPRAIACSLALGTVVAAALLAAASGGTASAGGQQLRIGLVLEQPIVSRSGDPFQYGAYRGLLRAARELHIRAKVVAPNPSSSGDPYIAPMSYLARQRYDLVIALGTLETGAVSRVARRFPREKFALLDGTRRAVKRASANVEGTIFHTEQPAYLAGFLAARMVDRGPRPHVVSSVAGVPIGTVQAYVAGFRAGARRADPRIKVPNAYTYDFVNPTKCRHAALDQIAHGSQVIFDVAGACGVGALKVAKRKGVFGIGVDIDQSYLGKYILTSVVKNLDSAVYALAKHLAAGRWRSGGNLSFNLRNRGVGLGKFSPEVPRTLRRKLVLLRTEIEQAKIRVPMNVNPQR
jgi:basic membrane protein A and related proteins